MSTSCLNNHFHALIFHLSCFGAPLVQRKTHQHEYTDHDQNDPPIRKHVILKKTAIVGGTFLAVFSGPGTRVMGQKIRGVCLDCVTLPLVVARDVGLEIPRVVVGGDITAPVAVLVNVAGFVVERRPCPHVAAIAYFTIGTYSGRHIHRCAPPGVDAFLQALLEILAVRSAHLSATSELAPMA